MNVMRHLSSLICRLTILVNVAASSVGINIKIVSIEGPEVSNGTDLVRNSSVKCNGAYQFQNSVQRIRDDAVFHFVQQEYEESLLGTESEWTVMLDLRRWACPLELKTRGLLGYLSLNPSSCSDVSPYTQTALLPLTTLPFRYKALLQAVAARSNFTLASVTFMFDSTGEDHYIQEPLDWEGYLVFQINIRVTNCNVTEELKHLTAKTEVRDIMVIATSACIEVILAEAARIELLEGRYRWVVYPTDGRLPPCPSCTGASVILIRRQGSGQDSCLHGLTTEERVEQFSDLAARRLAEAVTSNASLATMCSANCSQPCNPCRLAFRDLMYQMAGSALDVFVRDAYAPPTVLSIYKILGPNATATKIAEWRVGETTVNSEESLFPRSNYPIVLRVATIVEHPFVFRSESNGHVTYSGYSFDVINEIARRMGFDVSVKECDDGLYGYLDSDTDQWTGCVGNVVRGDADIIVGALTVTADRESVVDFTLPYFDFAGIQIVMRKKTQQIGRFYFAGVFTATAWGCLLGVVLVTSLLLLLFDHYTPEPPSVPGGRAPHRRFDFKESIWFVVGSLTMSGGGEAPQSFPARLLVAGFWFFSVIMMSTFTANLAAFLTVSRLGVSISSLDDLARQSEIKYSVVRQSSVMDYFKRMAAIEQNFYTLWKDMTLTGDSDSESFAVWHYPLGDKYDKIWKSIQDTGMMNSTEQALQRVSQGNFAFLSESPVVKFLTSRDCGLIAVGDQFSIRPYAFALKERSIYTKRISRQILELQQTRHLETLKRKWWNDGKVKCPEESVDSGLDLTSLVGSYVVVAIGLGSGFLFLLLEVIWARVQARKAKRASEAAVKPMAPEDSGQKKAGQQVQQTVGPCGSDSKDP